MSFDRLEYVIAIAEEQSITKAADRLYISQPALTASINKLEAELGVKLFDRQRPPVKLTPAGALYIKEMNRIHQLQFELKKHLSVYAKSKPTFTIGIGSGRGQNWLPLFLPQLQNAHPELDIRVKNGNYDSLENYYSSNAVDIVFGSLNFSNPDVQEEFLVKEYLVYIIPKSLNLITEEEYTGHSPLNPLLISPSILDGQPFVCTGTGSSYNRYLEFESNRYHFRPGDIFTYDYPPVALNLALRGMGIIFISQESYQWALELNERAYCCTLSEHMPFQNIHAFYNQNNPNLNLIHEVIDLIREHVIPISHSQNFSNMV
jgi:DNA-binding transcriptional LysR family regulator